MFYNFQCDIVPILTGEMQSFSTHISVGTPAIAIMAQERQEGKTSQFTGITLEELQKVADRSEQVCATVSFAMFQTLNLK